jgi:hypothetical protein
VPAALQASQQQALLPLLTSLLKATEQLPLHLATSAGQQQQQQAGHAEQTFLQQQVVAADGLTTLANLLSTSQLMRAVGAALAEAAAAPSPTQQHAQETAAAVDRQLGTAVQHAPPVAAAVAAVMAAGLAEGVAGVKLAKRLPVQLLQPLVAASPAKLQAAACRAAPLVQQQQGHGTYAQQQACMQLAHGCCALSHIKLAASGILQQHPHQQGPQQQLDMLTCLTTTIFSSSASLAGLFYCAAAQQPPAAAQQWLQEHSLSAVAQEVGALTRSAAALAARLPLPLLAPAAQHLCQQVQQLSAAYSMYSMLLLPPGFAGQLDSSAIRSSLDKAFVCAVTMASSMQQALQQSLQQQQQMPLQPSASSGSALMAQQQAEAVHTQVALLAAMAHLQFARVQYQPYTELLRALVSSITSSSAGCDLALAQLVPCYELIAAPVPSAAAGPGPARWEVDAVLLARLTFLLPLLPLFVRQGSSPAAAAHKVLPHVYLLLQHPEAHVSTAAHSSFAALVAGLGEAGQGELVEQAAPFYLARSLACFPGRCSAEGLAIGLQYLMKHLPAGSAMQLLVMELLAERCCALLREEWHAGVPATAAGAGGASGAGSMGALGPAGAAGLKDASAGVQLFVHLCQMLLAVDYELLPSGRQMVEGVLQGAGQAAALLPQLYLVLLTSDDYVRKPQLVRWFHQSFSSWQGSGAAEATQLQLQQAADLPAV